MRRLAITTGMLFTVPLIAFTQDFSKRFEEVFNSRDGDAQHGILVEWEANKPEDPDLQQAYFSFFKQRYESEMDSVNRNQFASNGLAHLNKGIREAPHRLDLWISKISFYWELKQYLNYKQSILALLEQHDIVKETWLWKNNSPLVGATAFLLQYIDGFVVQLYNTKDDSLHTYMDEVSNRVLVSYPRHIPSLSNLAITAMYRKDYETAINQLKDALAIDGTNTATLSNLAYSYEQTGQKEAAIDCYEKLVLYGGSETKNYAEKQLEKLKQ